MYPSYHQVFINFIFLLVLVLLFTILLIYRGKNKEDYRKIFDNLDDERINLTMDTGHFTSAEVDMIKFIEEFGPKIKHIHLKMQKDLMKIII